VEIAVTPRIGITQCADLPLRFLIRGNRYVSQASAKLTKRTVSHPPGTE
jgi:3-methyladenine DNA glycosylase Mpg